MRRPYTFRGFYKAQRGQNETRTKQQQPLRHCDLYVVRLLKEGRQLQGSGARDPARFGFSQPCVRCLRTLAAFGVHRVIYSTGEDDCDGAVGYEVREVRALLAASSECGHCSRGDRGAVASGAVRPQQCL